MNIQYRGSPVVGIIVGIVFMAVAIPFCYSNVRILSNSDVTTGMVTQVTTSRNSKGHVTYTPTIEFTTKTGEKISFKPSAMTFNTPNRQGEQIDVIYEKDNPSNAAVNDLSGMWIFPGIFFLMGLIVFVPSMIAMIAKRQQISTPSFGDTPPPGQPGQTQSPPTNP